METFISIGDSRNSGDDAGDEAVSGVASAFFPCAGNAANSFDRCAERFSLDISFGAGSKFDGETTPATGGSSRVDLFDATLPVCSAA
jgi:hypothetical protein